MRGMTVKSSHNTAAALAAAPFDGLPAPKRERGRQRVAAIMAAAMEVFDEKGYDAATMTEIAARSATAIGSLYRFFPSKEALADALLLRYAQHVTAGLGELEGEASRLSTEALAAALVDFMLTLQARRRFASTLVDARGGSDALRERFRAALRSGVARILLCAIEGLAPARAQAMALVVLHLLKGVSVTADEGPATQALFVGEIRTLVKLYLASAAGGGADQA